MRYLGCKTKLLREIAELMQKKKLFNGNRTFFDAFSGTGSVGDFFKSQFKIIANDIQYYSYVMTQAKLNAYDCKFEKLGCDPFDFFNTTRKITKGFIYNNYSPAKSDRMYFSEYNAGRIDFIRQTIEQWYLFGKITEHEYYYLIGCLLESVSKVSNVAGVYGSFLKTWDPRALKDLVFIPVEQDSVQSLYEAEVYNKPLEKLINDISGDILYLDTPYTTNQYSVQYHLLETIAKYDEPVISGKGGLRNTTVTSSDFTKKGNAEIAFEYIVAKAQFKHILLSYSSDGIMSEKFIEAVLKRYGKPETFEKVKIAYKQYKNYQTADKPKHEEYLFYIEKKDCCETTYASPLNYQGGKYDLIDFIKAHLPTEPINNFIDLFGGGYNVGVNIDADQIVYNDLNTKVKELIEMFKVQNTDDLVKYITNTIKKYKLAPKLKDEYMALRDAYNKTSAALRDVRMLYVLILYGFNQQIRFNSKYECNNPVGPAGFNDLMLEKLISFCRRIKEQNVVFLSNDFSDIWSYVKENTFVYCDPPYFITLGSYNDGKRGFEGWTQTHEMKLYQFLYELDKHGVKFMLSNVLTHKGKTNTILQKWLKTNDYKMFSYNGACRGDRKEILITNYEVEQ